MYVRCKVKSWTVICVCKVQSVEGDCYWFVYSALCRVRLFLVCVKCTEKCETVIGVCKVHSDV